MQVTFRDRHNCFPGGQQSFNSNGWAKDWRYDWAEAWLLLLAPTGKRHYFPREMIATVEYEPNDPYGNEFEANRLRLDYRPGTRQVVEAECNRCHCAVPGPVTQSPLGTDAPPAGHGDGPLEAEGGDMHEAFGEDVPQQARRPRGRPRKSVG